MRTKTAYRAFLLLFLLFVVGCKKKVDSAPTKKAAIEVTAVSVTQQKIKEYLIFNGVTVYQSKEDIRANVTGYISGMHHKIGSKIRSGQVFAYVRTKEQDALRDAVKIDSSLAKFINPISIRSNATGVIKILNVNPNDYVAMYNLGAIYANVEGKVAESKSLYRKSIRENPNYISPKTGLAKLLVLSGGDYDEALELFRDVLKIDPEYDDAKQLLGFLEKMKTTANKK